MCYSIFFVICIFVCQAISQFEIWPLFADMEDSVFSYLGDLTVGEGEEHVAKALTQEAAGLGVGQGTDDRVPGRLLGRQAEYEKIGAEPYIFRSEFLLVLHFIHVEQISLNFT